MNRKILLAIADGLGDRPCKTLKECTPLQYANAPTLDLLAKNGSCGIMDLLSPGIPVGTDLGHMILFGYDLKDYPGRGPIEAYGENMDLRPGDIALRCNFATVDDCGKILDRRAGRIRDDGKILAQAINGMEVDGVKVYFQQATEHRAVMILRGENLSEQITDTDPKIEGVPRKSATSKDGSESSVRTARIVNRILERAHRLLEEHEVNKKRAAKELCKANCILTRGAGKMPHLEKTAEKYPIKGCCVAAESTVLGVARLAGFDTRTAPTLTGNIDTDIEKKAELAVKALEEYDFVILHFKATDVMGHDNNPLGKIQAIERYDRMLEKVLSQTKEKENLIIALAADHSTPCERREHSGEPVPIVISGAGIRKDNVEKYDEISCAEGALCRLKGHEFFLTLFDYLEATKKEGN